MEWLKKVDEIREAEEWVVRCRDKSKLFTSIWAQWQKYPADPDPVPSSLEVVLLELAEPSLKLKMPVNGDVHT